MGQRDLTKGAVFPTMCLFALPMILGNLLQQCYNIVDSWVVGRYVGSAALGAVGSAFALMTFLTSVLLGLCMGSGVVFSLCFGTRDEGRLEDGLRAACVLAAVVTALLTAVSLLGVDGIVAWMNIPAEITELTRDYLVLVFGGIPAIALYNFFAAYLRALGNSVAPLAFLGISTALNIALERREPPPPRSSPSTSRAWASPCGPWPGTGGCGGPSTASGSNAPACGRSPATPCSPACSSL